MPPSDKREGVRAEINLAGRGWARRGLAWLGEA